MVYSAAVKSLFVIFSKPDDSHIFRLHNALIGSPSVIALKENSLLLGETHCRGSTSLDDML